MTTTGRTTLRAAALAAVLATAMGLAACGSSTGDGSGITLPSISTTTTEASTTTTTARESTTTTRESTTTSPPTTQAGSTTTTSGGSTTTADPTTTTTTAPPTTTTTAPTTTTTRATTSTTSRETTTTTAASGTTVAPTTTIDGQAASSDSSGVSPWIWVLIAALVLLAVLVAVLAVVRSRRSDAARWSWGARDTARRSGDAARRLEQAAALLGSPTADRQVWLDSIEELGSLSAAAAGLVPDAPKVPGDPEGTNTLASGLEALRSDLTVLRSAAVEAERTRFELVGPTAEQLGFATRSVEQAAAAVIGDAHAVAAAVDRVDPPQPTAPPR